MYFFTNTISIIKSSNTQTPLNMILLNRFHLINISKKEMRFNILYYSYKPQIIFKQVSKCYISYIVT